MKQDSNIQRVDKGWDRMNILLNEEMPQKKKRRKFFIILFFLGLAIIASRLYFSLESRSNNNPVAITKSTDKSSKSDQHNSNQIALNTNKSTQLIPEEKNESLNYDSKNTSEAIADHNSEHSQGESPHNSSIKKQDKKSSILSRNIIQNETAVQTSTQSDNTTNNSAIYANSESEKTIDIKNSNYSNTSNTVVIKPSVSHLYPIKNLHFNLLKFNHEREIKLAALTNIKPLNSPQITNSFDINYGISTSGFYNTDINLLGLASGLFGEIEINKRWGLGITAGYGHSKRNVTAANRLDNNDASGVDLPDGEGLPTSLGSDLDENLEGQFVLNAITTEERLTLIEQLTNNFSHANISIYGFYKPSTNVRFNLGIGLDQFKYAKSINNILVIDERYNSAIPFLSPRIFNNSRIIPKVDFGIGYSIFQNFEVFSKYEFALKNFYADPEIRLKTHRAHVGIRYTL